MDEITVNWFLKRQFFIIVIAVLSVFCPPHFVHNQRTSDFCPYIIDDTTALRSLFVILLSQSPNNVIQSSEIVLTVSMNVIVCLLVYIYVMFLLVTDAEKQTPVVLHVAKIPGGLLSNRTLKYHKIFLLFFMLILILATSLKQSLSVIPGWIYDPPWITLWPTLWL